MKCDICAEIYERNPREHDEFCCDEDGEIWHCGNLGESESHEDDT